MPSTKLDAERGKDSAVAEFADAPPELAVQGLECMASLGMTMVSSSGSSSFESPASRAARSMQSMVSAQIRTTDMEILRGIMLRESLKKGACLWRKNPMHLSVKTRAKLFLRSRHVTHLDMFISHTWSAGGWSKALSLLMQSGCMNAMALWLLGIMLAIAFSLTEVLPMSFTYSSSMAKFALDCPLGPWSMVFGSFGTLFGLLLSPYCPSPCRSVDMCFIDAACIHQTDKQLMQRGIRGIAGFLVVSRELRILWSSAYLSRLWCVFELATYRKLNPSGKVVVAPLFVEGLVLLFYSGLFFGSITYWSIRAGGGGRYIVLPGLLLCSFPLLFSVHLLRRNYLRKRNLFSQFQNFDLDAALCASESDRDFIYTAIAHLYGSHQAFTNYVRGPLREELLGPLCHSVIPQKYTLLILLPLVSMTIDFTLAVVKQGAPVDVIVFYVTSMVVLLNFAHVRASINLMFLLCDCFAEPLHPSHVAGVLQSLLVFLLFMLHSTSGVWLCLQAQQANSWAFLAGIFVAIAVAFVVASWLQSKYTARQLLKMKCRTQTPAG